MRLFRLLRLAARIGDRVGDSVCAFRSLQVPPRRPLDSSRAVGGSWKTARFRRIRLRAVHPVRA
jgi:hypothetical protein